MPTLSDQSPSISSNNWCKRNKIRKQRLKQSNDAIRIFVFVLLRSSIDFCTTISEVTNFISYKKQGFSKSSVINQNKFRSSHLMCGLWACVGVVIEGEGELLGSVRGRQMKFEYLWVGNLSLYISWKIKRVSNVWSGKWKSRNSIFCLQKPVLANHSSTV